VTGFLLKSTDRTVFGHDEILEESAGYDMIMFFGAEEIQVRYALTVGAWQWMAVVVTFWVGHGRRDGRPQVE